jgi:hypothetical protein
MALTWSPKQFELARAEELALSASLASSRPWIVSGLALSAGTGLNVAISAGVAWIDGYVVSWDAATEQAVTGSATNHVWIELTRDVNDNVTAVAFVINTTGTPPTGDYVKLGTATTNGSAVTGTATTGRSPQTQVLVSSVFGRDGAVVATAGDYDADQVDYDNATSGLSATDVQEAVDELAARPTSSGWNGILIKLADQVRVGDGNDTLNDDNELFFPVAANSTYYMEFDLIVSSGSPDGMKVQLDCPSGTTGEWQFMRYSNQTTANQIVGTLFDQAINSEVSLGFSNGNYTVRIVSIITTDSTAGTFKLRWAKNSTGNGGDLNVRKYSSLKYRDIT